ncbi:MAG: serine hydrolase [Cyclobacteriaceae bacterium]|nr:serine hydrolase [Cyclobacteriaceae bacterium HetDA_MAG_MS6]
MIFQVNVKATLYSLVLICTITSCIDSAKESSIDQLEKAIIDTLQSTEGDFAVAFLDLQDTTRQILINADEQFHAASTMKTPVMIVLYQQARAGKFDLTDTIIIKNEFRSIVDDSPYSLDVNVDGGEELYKRIGEPISIYDLIYDMITVSSNLATNILIEIADAKEVTSLMRGLGATKIEVLRGVEDQKAYDSGLSNSTTARDLLMIMKAIASNEAGTQEDCQAMVDILKDQKFNDMIPKYLPKEAVVAHKTGVITALHHDSGIVFLPGKRAYVLILLSKNLSDFEEGTDKLARISEMIYKDQIGQE